MCILVKFAKFLKALFSIEHVRWLLLNPAVYLGPYQTPSAMELFPKILNEF